MLRIKNVNTYYGQVHALKNVSLHLNEGEIVALLGANGAGKTTLLRTVSGLLRPRAGQIIFGGRDIGGVPAERIVFAGCSLVPEGRQVFAAMPVRENLLFFRVARAGFLLDLGGPPRPLSFVDVEDCARGMRLLAVRPEALGEAFFTSAMSAADTSCAMPNARWPRT